MQGKNITVMKKKTFNAKRHIHFEDKKKNLPLPMHQIKQKLL